MAISMTQVRAQKAVIEYPLPGTRQTHEVVAIGEDLLIVSQQDCSGLLKVKLDVNTGRPVGVRRFQMGSSKYSGFHGLYASKKHPGWLWGTLQFESKLLLIDPQGSELHREPQIISSIQLPSQVWGPHVVIEDNDNVWTSCKGSGDVVKVNTAAENSFTVYKCDGRPIFVAVHPTSKEVYASLDLQSQIFCIALDGKTSHIDIPACWGSTPVGLVPGPDGNVWFVLLGSSSGGMGTFGCITSKGDITWFKLPADPLGSNIGLIHLAFEPASTSGNGDNNDNLLKVWLLGSTLSSTNSIDAVFTVNIEGGNSIVRQDTIFMPTQPCFTHRVLPHQTGVFVTELGVSVLAHATGAGIGVGAKLSLRQVYETPSETSDRFALWGLGGYAEFFNYAQEDAWGPPSVLNTEQQDDDRTSKKRAYAQLTH